MSDRRQKTRPVLHHGGGTVAIGGTVRLHPAMPLTKAEVTRLRSLREKKIREALGLFVVEGAKVVGELITAKQPLLELYATPEWTAPALEETTVLHRVLPDEMARISHFPTPSPVLAVGPIVRASLAAGELNHGYTLALDGIQDAGNVGTLLRTADWFGFARVLLSPTCADLFSQKVINASMGSFTRIRTITTPLAPAFATATVPVLGCDLAGTSLDELAPPSAAVIVIGSEGQGLSADVAACLTQRVTIPRWGGAESLNAAVAAGIVCAWIRRRGGA